MKLPSLRAARSKDGTPRIQNDRRAARAAATALLAVCACAGAAAQSLQPVQPSAVPASTLPPTPPTSLPAAATATAASAASAAPAASAGSAAQMPAEGPPQYAPVTYRDGQIEVHANNSSLNQILRSIARLTGLKIDGGVADQRVYGAYGPAPAATVLATLLDGTGTNLLLLEGSASTPGRLILSPRGGGAAPPGPDSPLYAAYDRDGAASDSAASDSASYDSGGPNPSSTALALPNGASTNGASNNGASNNGASNNGASAGTMLTPEMVAQKLLQMQEQQTPQPAAGAAQTH